MKEEIKILNNLPERLKEIPDKPKKLYIKGEFPNEEMKFLAVVGSRRLTSYGKDACEKLISDLAGHPIVIVSGLALGMDSIAHKSALLAGLKTVVIPGSGLSRKVLYPKSNFGLANKILESGGCLLSEFEPDFSATPWSFPQRNRIMAGISDAVLVVEANEKSGTLITARLGMEYNRDVLVVPGSIFSTQSKGTNELIKNGAHPVTSAEDILHILGLNVEEQIERSYENCGSEEMQILNILEEPMSKEELVQNLDLSITDTNMFLSMLEIKGLIKESAGMVRKI